ARTAASEAGVPHDREARRAPPRGRARRDRRRLLDPLVGHLAADLHREAAGVEAPEVVDPGTALARVLEGLGGVPAERGDHAHAGDDDAPTTWRPAWRDRQDARLTSPPRARKSSSHRRMTSSPVSSGGGAAHPPPLIRPPSGPR